MKKIGTTAAYLMAAALLAYTWFALVPASFLSSLSNPAHFASLGGLVCVVVLIGTSIWPPKDPKFAPSLLAQILVSMPIFYIWAAVRAGTQQDVLIEIAGLLIFGGIALYGYLKSPIVLGIGIVAHGLCWDSWHHQHSVIFDSWYPAACLIFDVAVGMAVIAKLSGTPKLAREASLAQP
jgi:hypothetical protein